MTRNEYISERDRIHKMEIDLNRRYSEEHPIMEKFGGKIIKVYDPTDKEWTPPFRLKKVKYGYYGHDVLHGNIIEDGVEKSGLVMTCEVDSTSKIEVLDISVPVY